MLSSQGHFSRDSYLLHRDLSLSTSCCCRFRWLIMRCFLRLQLGLWMLLIDLGLSQTRVWLKIFCRSSILQIICCCTVRMPVRTYWLEPPVKRFSISALALDGYVPKYLLALHGLKTTSAKWHFMFTEIALRQLIRRGLCKHDILCTCHGRMFEVMQVLFGKRRADLVRGRSMLKAILIDWRITSRCLLGILSNPLCTTIFLATSAFHAKSIG